MSTPDRFAANPTSSNETGVTLMNNQAGQVVAEIMSTHYGRMVVMDDRVVMFANPEDAAQYTGFDLPVVEA